MRKEDGRRKTEVGRGKQAVNRRQQAFFSDLQSADFRIHRTDFQQ